MVDAVFEILFIQTCIKPTKTGFWRQLFTIFLPLIFSGNVENTSRKLTILKCKK